MPQTRNLYARRDEQAIHDMMLRLNSKAWGIALFVATNFLVLKGGDPVGPHLSLLGIYFPGYRVTFLGSLIGFVYAFVIGYGLGRLIGTVYNRMVGPTR
jgi:hypothetical protein